MILTFNLKHEIVVDAEETTASWAPEIGTLMLCNKTSLASRRTARILMNGSLNSAPLICFVIFEMIL